MGEQLTVRQAREVLRRYGYIVRADRMEPGRIMLQKDGMQRSVPTEELLLIATRFTDWDRERVA